jgi:ubiquinone/menaquinone biosynthesis C-methylase UbiE
MAPFYDTVYTIKNYSGEAKHIRAEIRAHCRSGGCELLDVGCGTGLHIQYLQKWYDCTGIDASAQMLKVARERLPGVSLVKARMETFDLGKQFDAIICMFGAIAYTRTVPGLRKAIGRMAGHLKPGGVLLIQPFETPSSWRPGYVSTRVTEKPGLAVARATSSFRPSRLLSRFEMHYLIAREHEPIRHISEVHELALFDPRTIREAIKAAGLRSKFVPMWNRSRHGLHIGVKPLA